MLIFSGIQPTGQLHIGNYLGATKQWVELQKNQECIFSIVDLHSLTIPYDPINFQKIIMETAIAHLAIGIEPEKSLLFVQSQVKEHTELTWLLNTICPVGELQRMTQYKEKSRQFKKNINAGLLNYPILMAADILLYQTDIVPIGKDQKQHLELTKMLAKKFNQKFGETFKIPKAQIPKIGSKIMALNNPKKKMSKSIPQSCLFLFDEPETIRKKIMSAVTDTGKTIKYDTKRKPGISNLLTIYSLFSEKPVNPVRDNRGKKEIQREQISNGVNEIEKKFKNKGYAEFKKQLAELLVLQLEPFQRKRKELLKREVYVKEILNQGAKKAQTIAQSTLQKVKQKMGLL